MKRFWKLPDGRQLDLTYFVNWRPYLWARPIADALDFLGDLRGRSLLEIGGGDGRMTSLLAMSGAKVTVIETCDLSLAEKETAKWGVSDRVRLIQTQGGFDELNGEKFDVVFSKSVLWCIPNLDEFLSEIDAHLAEKGKVAFIENHRGGKFLFWLRRHALHRPSAFHWEHIYHGITPGQLDMFRKRFLDVSIRRYRCLVYRIFGQKRPEARRYGNHRSLIT